MAGQGGNQPPPTMAHMAGQGGTNSAAGYGGTNSAAPATMAYVAPAQEAAPVAPPSPPQQHEPRPAPEVMAHNLLRVESGDGS